MFDHNRGGRGGGGISARPLRKKVFFFIYLNILFQKFRRFFLSKCVSGYFKTKKERRKKVPMATKPRGGVKALVVGPLRLSALLNRNPN